MADSQIWLQLAQPTSPEDLVYFAKLIVSSHEAANLIAFHSKDARWDIVSKAMETLERGFEKKGYS